MKNTGNRVFAFLLACAIAVLYILFVPPMHPVLVAGLIALAALVGVRAVAVFTGDRTYHLLTALFIALFLALQTTIGFNVVNTILLASFIIGVGIFLKEQ